MDIHMYVNWRVLMNSLNMVWSDHTLALPYSGQDHDLSAVPCYQPTAWAITLHLALTMIEFIIRSFILHPINLETVKYD